MAFQLIMHPGTENWRPSGPHLAKLQGYFADPTMRVEVMPRAMANSVLGRPTAPYAFRAFTRNGISYVFVDRTESPQSIAWLMAHELCHQLVDRSPTIEAAMADARDTSSDPAGDRFHDIDPEERFCDGIATRLLGYRQDRAWWRNTLQRMGHRT